MIKRVLKLAGIGFLVGVVVRDLIAIMSIVDSITINPAFLERMGGNVQAAMLVSTLLSGLYGAFCMSGVALYEADRLPLAASTLLHCLLCIIPFAPLSLFLGWSDGISQILVMAGFQIAAFFIVWLIFYAQGRSAIKKMNEIQKLHLDKSKTEDEK